MYEVLDVKVMVRDIRTQQVRKRTKPLRGYESVLLCKPGTSMKWIPPNSLIKKTPEGYWEVYTLIKNKKTLKMLAKVLDAVAYL